MIDGGATCFFSWLLRGARSRLPFIPKKKNNKKTTVLSIRTCTTQKNGLLVL